jgi:hypothetical protein
VTIDGDLTSVEDILGSIHIYRRDIQCLNNFVMDIIIICPEAVIGEIWGDLNLSGVHILYLCRK